MEYVGLQGAATPGGPGGDTGWQSQHCFLLQGLTGQQAVPSWGCAYSKFLPAQGPSDIHPALDLCQTPTMCPAWSKEQQDGVRRRKRKTPAHVMPDPCEMGRCTPTSGA